MFVQKCCRCLEVQPATQYTQFCPSCGAEIIFDYPQSSWRPTEQRSMWRFADLLPVQTAEVISLGEGCTPLIASRGLAKSDVYLKLEMLNPTGSMKDRAASISLTKAKEFGFSSCVVASTGSSAISVAAYGARAGLTTIVLVPQGLNRERMGAVEATGAIICEIEGTFDKIMNLLTKARGAIQWYEATTCRRANPYQAEAAKTIAYECYQDLQEMPDWVVVPIGGGGTLAGIYQGFVDIARFMNISRLPRFLGVQSSSFNLLERALAQGLTKETELQAIPNPHPDNSSLATNIAQWYPPDGLAALDAIRRTKGTIISVDDEEALQAKLDLARIEGLNVEISSAVTIAGIRRMEQQGRIKAADKVIACITGSGFRESAPVSRPAKIHNISGIDSNILKQLSEVLANYK